jgi:hypothetical protein
MYSAKPYERPHERWAACLGSGFDHLRCDRLEQVPARVSAVLEGLQLALLFRGLEILVLLLLHVVASLDLVTTHAFSKYHSL